jgi:hypothetical protein
MTLRSRPVIWRIGSTPSSMSSAEQATGESLTGGRLVVGDVDRVDRSRERAGAGPHELGSGRAAARAPR